MADRLYGYLWTTTNRLVTGSKQCVEMSSLSSGTKGKPSSSYRMAFCVELAIYRYNNLKISNLGDFAIRSERVRKMSHDKAHGFLGLVISGFRHTLHALPLEG